MSGWERHVWTVTYEDGSNVPGALPWYTRTAANRLARETAAAGRVAVVTRDGRPVETFRPEREGEA